MTQQENFDCVPPACADETRFPIEDSKTSVSLGSDETLTQVNESIRLIQREGGLHFGTDAYLLAAYVTPHPRARAVDLGSGTGIIPLLCLARAKVASVVAVELQPSFCDLINRNARLNGYADLASSEASRLRALQVDVRSLHARDVGGEVDIVTANPPYMAPGAGKTNQADELTLARHEIAGGIGDFCAAAGRLLKHGGRFYCVFRPERLGDLFLALREAHLEPKRMTAVQATVSAPPSMVLIEAVKYASPSLRLTPPLCLSEPDLLSPHKPAQPLVQTADAAYVYEHCAFPPAFTGENRRG